MCFKSIFKTTFYKKYSKQVLFNTGETLILRIFVGESIAQIMSNYIVSARKYRPQRFDEVVGQNHVSDTLKNALRTEHLAHAFLFCGPRGVGKTTCARILAKVLNCQNLTADHEPCNACNSCESFNGNASFNITELDAASNNSVEHIRALIEQVRFQPQQGKYKVFIIDEVHMLSQQAFNAFLKTLEEPPSYAIFILATTEKHKIIPTILSRCQIFDFRRIQVQDTVKHLEQICKEEGITAEPDALHIIAQKADGALRDALSIFDRMVSFSSEKITYQDVITNLNILDYDYFLKITNALMASDLKQMLLIFNDILKKGFDPDIFMNGLAEHLRNLLVCKDEATLQLLEVGEALQSKYRQQAQLAEESFLLTALSIANDCDINYKMARNKRLHTEMALIRMCHIAQALEPQQIPVAIPEKKTPDSSESLVKAPKIVESQVATAIPATPITQSTPSEAKVISPVVPPIKKPDAKPILASSKSNIKLSAFKVGGALGSLSEIESEVMENSASYEEKASTSLEEVQKTWVDYANQVDSPSAKAYLKNTEVRLFETEIEAIVASTVAEGAIRTEQKLMHFMRQHTGVRGLTMKITIDPSRRPKGDAVVVKKLLTNKEKFEKMVDRNPALTELRKKFDLRIDQV